MSFQHNERAGETRYHLRWPETGGVRIFLEIILLAHLVVIATPVLVEQIRVMNPAIVPEPFTTILHGTLMIGIIAVAVWLFWSGSLVTTYRYDERDDLKDHLERDLPDRQWFLRHAGLTVFGGALALITYEQFVATFVNVLDLLVIVIEEFEWAITITDGLFAGGFVIGFVLFAVGVDRLVVGGLRWWVHRRHDSY